MFSVVSVCQSFCSQGILLQDPAPLVHDLCTERWPPGHVQTSLYSPPPPTCLNVSSLCRSYCWKVGTVGIRPKCLLVMDTKVEYQQLQSFINKLSLIHLLRTEDSCHYNRKGFCEFKLF